MSNRPRRWSDPDELLHEWALLTARSSPRIPSRGTTLARYVPLAGAVASIGVVVAVALAVLSSSSLGPIGPSPSPFSVAPPTPIETNAAPSPSTITSILLPTHDEGGITHGVLGGSRLERRGDCVYGGPWLIVWPMGWTLDTSTEPAVVRDALGTPTAAVGDYVSLEGRPIQDVDAELSTVTFVEPIPSSCAVEWVWIAGAKVDIAPAGAATWQIDPSAPPAAQDQTVHVLLNENGCSGGTSPEGRVLPPQIEYRADAIVMTLEVQSVGVAACPSNPDYAMTIELTEPIGERVLIDGLDGGVRWQPDHVSSQPAWWRVDPNDPPRSDGRSVQLLVTESVCTLGSAQDRLLPRIEYKSGAVVIGLSSRDTGARCPSDYPTSFTVELDEPTGDRVLIDGLDGEIRWDPSFWRWMPGPDDEVAQYLVDLIPGHAKGQPFVAYSFTSPTVDPPGDDVLARLDREIAGGRRLDWSRAEPRFFLGVAGSLWKKLTDEMHSVDLFEGRASLWAIVPTQDGGWSAIRIKSFKTPGGNVVSAIDETMTAWDDCSKVVTPPIRTGGVDPISTGYDPETGEFEVEIYGQRGDDYTLIQVDSRDAACQAHPVLGPIIEHILSDD